MDLGGPKMPALVLKFVEVSPLENLRGPISETICSSIRPLLILAIDLAALWKQPTGIQITDLQTILNIIDLASSRGAFRAPELTQVGAIADKLGAFLGALAEQQKANKEAEGKPADAPADAPAEAPAEEKKE